MGHLLSTIQRLFVISAKLWFILPNLQIRKLRLSDLNSFVKKCPPNKWQKQAVDPDDFNSRAQVPSSSHHLCHLGQVLYLLISLPAQRRKQNTQLSSVA